MPLIQVAPGRHVDTDSVVAVTGDQYGNAFVQLINDHGLSRRTRP